MHVRSVTHFVNLFMWAICLFQMIRQSSWRPAPLKQTYICTKTQNTLKLLSCPPPPPRDALLRLASSSLCSKDDLKLLFSCLHFLSSESIYQFYIILGMEPRALCVLDKHSTNRTTSPAHSKTSLAQDHLTERASVNVNSDTSKWFLEGGNVSQSMVG